MAEAGGGTDVRRYGVFERSFLHRDDWANPYRDIEAVATLERPDGGVWSIPLFWDGDTTWKLRVSPDAEGTWSYGVRSSDPGLDGANGSFRCIPSALQGSIRPMAGYPLHFERQDGSPFLFLGDKAWRLLQTDRTKKLDHASALHHVDARAGQGFTYMHTELAGTGGLDSGGNEGGEMLLDARREVINPAFFREVDLRLSHVAARGMVFGLVLLYAIGDPSWRSLPTMEARLRFARYAVARYGAYPVVFLVTGEWHYMVREFELFRAIGREIRRTDPHGRMIGIHPGPGPWFSSQDFAGEEWMSFGEYAQAYFAPDREEANDYHRHDLRDFTVAARRHGKPVVHAEYAYYLRDQDFDGVVDKPNSHTRESFRRASWMIPMGGGYFVTGFGTTYFGGRREVGPFLVDNPCHADALADLAALKQFFTSFEWWKLEPHDEFVRAEKGFAYCIAETGRAYAVFCVGGKGASLALADGEWAVERWDPRTGAVERSVAPAVSGRLELSAPDAQDWAFAVRAGP
jgi:hypothetical protein